MVRALKLTQLVCNDSEPFFTIGAAERKFSEFMSAIQRNGPAESPQDELKRLAVVLQSGLRILKEFAVLARTAVERGLDVYRRRRSWWQLDPQRLLSAQNPKEQPAQQTVT